MLSTNEVFLPLFFCCFRCCWWLAPDALWSFDASAESVLDPWYLAGFRALPPANGVVRKLEARPMLVISCCWRRRPELEPSRPELTAAACICVSALRWWISWRLSRSRDVFRHPCSSPAFNNLKTIFFYDNDFRGRYNLSAPTHPSAPPEKSSHLHLLYPLIQIFFSFPFPVASWIVTLVALVSITSEVRHY